eukprot:TRINITY_DN1849_c0_g1_i1.p1 TRINITY_DN1849_c0_g1~~TRINITY_DN1849_c0_g1_i1.p1  ORF type:complete len:611 (+),score=113.40 TRINITY_DN1849_c0_g1_i1:76-1833(+)
MAATAAPPPGEHCPHSPARTQAPPDWISKAVKELLAVMDTEETHAGKLRTIQQLENLLRTRLPKAQVFLVGSTIQGSSLKCSDLDIAVNIDGDLSWFVGVKVTQGEEIHDQLRRLQDVLMLSEQSREFKFEVIHARVPIIKNQPGQSGWRRSTGIGGVDFDLSVRPQALWNGRLIRAYAERSKAVQVGLVLTKVWGTDVTRIISKQLRMLNSFAMANMFIYALVRKKLVEWIDPKQIDWPSDKDRAASLHEFLHRGNNPDHAQLSREVLPLLMAFFEFYAQEFDWENGAVSLMSSPADTVDCTSFCFKGVRDALRVEDRSFASAAPRNVASLIDSDKLERIKEQFRSWHSVVQYRDTAQSPGWREERLQEMAYWISRVTGPNMHFAALKGPFVPCTPDKEESGDSGDDDSEASSGPTLYGEEKVMRLDRRDLDTIHKHVQEAVKTHFTEFLARLRVRQPSGSAVTNAAIQTDCATVCELPSRELPSRELPSRELPSSELPSLASPPPAAAAPDRALAPTSTLTPKPVVAPTPVVTRATPRPSARGRGTGPVAIGDLRGNQKRARELLLASRRMFQGLPSPRAAAA